MNAITNTFLGRARNQMLEESLPYRGPGITAPTTAFPRRQRRMDPGDPRMTWMPRVRTVLAGIWQASDAGPFAPKGLP